MKDFEGSMEKVVVLNLGNSKRKQKTSVQRESRLWLAVAGNGAEQVFRVVALVFFFLAGDVNNSCELQVKAFNGSHSSLRCCTHLETEVLRSKSFGQVTSHQGIVSIILNP
jgi:hypothetical protein